MMETSLKIGDIISEEDYLKRKQEIGIHSSYRSFAGTYTIEVFKDGYEIATSKEGEHEVYGKKTIMMLATSEDAKKYKNFYDKRKV